MNNPSSNIITRRDYSDGSIALEINGRPIPDALLVQLADDNTVYIRVGCGQFNYVHTDNDPPPNIRSVIVHGGYLRKNDDGTYTVRPYSWRERLERWWNDRE